MSSYELSFEFNEITKHYTINHKKYPLGKFVFDFLDMNIDDIEFPTAHVSSNLVEWSFPSIANDDYLLNLILYDYVDRNSAYANTRKHSCIEWLHDLQNTLSYNLLSPETFELNLSEEGNNVIINDSFATFFGSAKVTLKFERYVDTTTDFYCYYSVDKINALLLFDYVKLRAHNCIVKKCANCGKYFIPSKRTDEIYCDRIFKSNRTCKQVGYEEKEKKDPFSHLYTKARKTQYARIAYNSHIKNYREKHYEPWKKAAEQAREAFKRSNDFEGFKKWIEENKNKF